MRIEDLQTFQAVTRFPSLNQAAAELGVSQSTLTKTLARLEAETGLKLFDRSRQGVTLTELGQTFARYAQNISITLDAMHAEMGDMHAARAGKVRLATLPHLLPSLVSPVMRQFLASRPLATFSVSTSLSPHLLAQLQTGEVDLVCASIPDEIPAGIAVAPIGALQVQIAVSANHPRLNTLQGFTDLAQERWIMPSSSIYLRQWLNQRFVRLGLPPPRIAVESNGSQLAFTELMRYSDLIGMLPSHTLAQPEGAGLVGLSGEGMRWQHDLALLWREQGYLSALTQEFRDAMLQAGQQMAL